MTLCLDERFCVADGVPLREVNGARVLFGRGGEAGDGRNRTDDTRVFSNKLLKTRTPEDPNKSKLS